MGRDAGASVGICKIACASELGLHIKADLAGEWKLSGLPPRR